MPTRPRGAVAQTHTRTHAHTHAHTPRPRGAVAQTHTHTRTHTPRLWGAVAQEEGDVLARYVLSRASARGTHDTRTHKHTNTRSIRPRARAQTRADAQSHTKTHARTHVDTRTYTCARTHTHPHTRTHTHTGLLEAFPQLIDYLCSPNPLHQVHIAHSPVTAAVQIQNRVYRVCRGCSLSIGASGRPRAWPRLLLPRVRVVGSRQPEA